MRPALNGVSDVVALDNRSNSLQESTKDVARATRDNVADSHLVTGKVETLCNHDMGHRDDCGETQGDEGEGAVPAVALVVRGEDNLIG